MASGRRAKASAREDSHIRPRRESSEPSRMNNKAWQGYLATAVGVLVEVIRDAVTQASAPAGGGMHVPTSGWGFLAMLLIGMGARLLHKAQPSAPAPEITPTPDLTMDEASPELGRASGEAGAAAARGPFKKPPAPPEK